MGVEAIALGVMAVGSIFQGVSAKNAADRNAANSKKNAAFAMEKAKEDERRQRIEGRRALGNIRSGYAASGVNLEGSALDVLEDSAATSERDALEIRHRGERASADFLADADSETRSGNASLYGGLLGGAAYALQAGGSSKKKDKE